MRQDHVTKKRRALGTRIALFSVAGSLRLRACYLFLYPRPNRAYPGSRKLLPRSQFAKLKEGDIGGYPIPSYRKKKWQIPKYRVENRLNTDTAYFNHIYNHWTGSAYLWLLPSSAFNYLRHLCSRCPRFFLNILVVRKFSLKSKLRSFNLLVARPNS